MTPTNIVTTALRVTTDLGAGVLATEIVKNLAPMSSTFGPVKRILCGIGAIGIAESMRISASAAIEQDICDVKRFIKDAKSFLNRMDEEDLSIITKKKKIKTQEKVDIPKTYKAFKPKEDSFDWTDFAEKSINVIPATTWRDMIVAMGKEEGDTELVNEFLSYSDEELKEVLKNITMASVEDALKE